MTAENREGREQRRRTARLGTARRGGEEGRGGDNGEEGGGGGHGEDGYEEAGRGCGGHWSERGATGRR